MPKSAKLIPLGDLCAQIAAATGSPPPGGYRAMLDAALNGMLPGATRLRGRWYVPATALPQISHDMAGHENPPAPSPARAVATRAAA